MSVEELTEQMAKAMELAEQPQSHASKDATKPQLPLGHSLAANKTVDEVLADLNKSPLFMTELEENDDIEALKALNYEGTALENGTDFKERGNECFRARRYVDAKEFYSKGVQILAGEERKREKGEVTKSPEGVEDTEEEISEQKKALESIYVNRAACHLELQNFRSCWTDCGAAMKLNPKNLKACYRSARALLAVGRILEADDVCARGLAIDAENKALQAVAADILKKAQEEDVRRNKAAEREAKEKRKAILLKAALKARGIPTRKTEKPPEMEDAKLELVPDPLDPRSSLSFPTVLLYPAHLETDFIKGFNETQTLEDHLGYVFPLPWDKQGVYTQAGTECYVETKEGGLLKMGKRVPLLKILTTGKVEVVDDVMKIFVLPKAEAEAWVKKFKEQKAAMLGKAS